MNATARLRDNPFDIAVPSPTPTGIFPEPNLHSDLDEKANSAEISPEQSFSILREFNRKQRREESNTRVGIGTYEMSELSLPNTIAFVTSFTESIKEFSWTHQLTSALTNDDIWERLVHQAPERALIRWIKARKLSSETETSIQLDIPNAASTDRLLTLLAESPSNLRNEVFVWLNRLCSPQVILDSSLARYEQTSQEHYLLQAISLLESVGENAWPALRKLSQSKRLECELFVGLITRCDGIDVKERVSAIRELARNPHAEVRSAIIEQLSVFDQDSQWSILEILANDNEPEISQEAKEYLTELE